MADIIVTAPYPMVEYKIPPAKTAAEIPNCEQEFLRAKKAPRWFVWTSSVWSVCNAVWRNPTQRLMSKNVSINEIPHGNWTSSNKGTINAVLETKKTFRLVNLSLSQPASGLAIIAPIPALKNIQEISNGFRSKSLLILGVFIILGIIFDF